MLETRNLQIPERRIDPEAFRRCIVGLEQFSDEAIIMTAMARDKGAKS